MILSVFFGVISIFQAELESVKRPVAELMFDDRPSDHSHPVSLLYQFIVVAGDRLGAKYAAYAVIHCSSS